jgi:hypothetical protein
MKEPPAPHHRTCFSGRMNVQRECHSASSDVCGEPNARLPARRPKRQSSVHVQNWHAQFRNSASLADVDGHFAASNWSAVACRLRNQVRRFFDWRLSTVGRSINPRTQPSVVENLKKLFTPVAGEVLADGFEPRVQPDRKGKALGYTEIMTAERVNGRPMNS